ASAPAARSPATARPECAARLGRGRSAADRPARAPVACLAPIRGAAAAASAATPQTVSRDALRAIPRAPAGAASTPGRANTAATARPRDGGNAPRYGAGRD